VTTIIAVDGPVASGKRTLAKKLSWLIGLHMTIT
jgi:cytidylate kinase